MHYKFSLGTCFLNLFSLIIYAQPGFVENSKLNTVKVYDANGRAFVNPLIDIEGSPFFIDQWKYATVKHNDSTSYPNVPVKLNLYSEKGHFLSGKNELTFIPGFVKEFIFIDSSIGKMKSYTFRNGFPAINKQNENSYYLVLCDGKFKYIEYMYRKVDESKNPISGEIKKELVSYEEYYFFNAGSLTLIKRNKGFLLDQMSDKKDAIEKFIVDNKISCKDPDKIKLVVDYYNSL